MSEAAFVSASEVRAIAVLGAGTMGHGIAQVAAMAGYDVVLRDLDLAAVQRGVERIRGNLDKGVARGKVTQAAREAALARVRTTISLEEAASAADLVIEAAPETMELKRSLVADIAAAAPARAVIATNTSSLSIAEIATAADRPERVVGMHFFNPVHIMKLVEVVAHAGCDAGVVACAREVAERFGKTAITVADAPGFASSRLGLALGLEAIRMVEQGVASAEDIDTAMKLGYGHPMGPLELTDLVGLDVRLSIARYLCETLGPSFEPPELLERMVAEGKVGAKCGQGFYAWEDGARKVR